MANLSDAKILSIDEMRERARKKLGYEPCLWQLRIVEALLKRDKDIVLIAETGGGKTLTFMLPLEFCQEGIIIVITPLNLLGKQNVDTLTKMGIRGIALSAETATRENFRVSYNSAY